MKKISVIVPIYNVEKYLETCINSIINQTYKNLEIILVEDGSPDSCCAICNELAKKDNRIKVIHKQNEGLSNARNSGIKIATGDYISFIDSDDIIDTDMFEVLVKTLEENNADISMCRFITFRENTKPKFKKSNVIKKYSSREAISSLLTGKLTSNMWNKLYKKELFKDFRLESGVIFEDIIAMHQIFHKANIIVENKSECYGYMKRNDSIIGTVNEKMISSYIYARDKRCKFLEKYYPELKNDIFAYKTNETLRIIATIARAKRKDLLKIDIVENSYITYRENYKTKEYKEYLKELKFSKRFFKRIFCTNINVAYILYRFYCCINNVIQR